MDIRRYNHYGMKEPEKWFDPAPKRRKSIANLPWNIAREDRVNGIAMILLIVFDLFVTGVLLVHLAYTVSKPTQSLVDMFSVFVIGIALLLGVFCVFSFCYRR